PARRVGLRPALPVRDRTACRLARLPAPLQPSPLPHRNRRTTGQPRSQPLKTEQLATATLCRVCALSWVAVSIMGGTSTCCPPCANSAFTGPVAPHRKSPRTLTHR